MICPSCSENLAQGLKHCIRCGISITRRSVQMAQAINNFGWIARRSLGGFFAGALGSVLAIAVSRAVNFDAASVPTFARTLDFFPGQSPFTTAIAGCFVGTVGGMIERSTYKAVLGGLLGTLGGMLGGLAFPSFQKIFGGALYQYSFALGGAWCLAGMLVGLTSGLLEGTKSKILAGIVGGALGGFMGGGIGSQMYGAMLLEVGSPEKLNWGLGRMLEFSSGGIVGANIWFFIGLAEKLYIFKRRQLIESTHKVCDHCHSENVLKAWYCAECGSALQVAAQREQMHVTPYRGLERISNAFQFLSWLSATAGIVTATVVFVSFLAQNFLFALFGSMLIALVIYMVSIVFRAFADTLKLGLQITDKISKESAPR